MERTFPKYAEVILPLAISNTLTYSIPDDISPYAAVGSRVVVPIKGKFYTGIIAGFPANVSADFQIKPISMLLDEKPVVRSPQLKLWQWISEYYLCTQGEVYRAAVPSGLKIESETVLELNADYEPEPDEPALTDRQLEVVLFLSHRKSSAMVSLIQREIKTPGLPSTLESLIRKGVVRISEKLAERYHARKVNYVELSMNPKDAFGAASGKTPQETLLLAYLELAKEGTDVSRELLLAKAGMTTLSTLQTMVKKGIFNIVRKEVNRFSFSGELEKTLPNLSEDQIAARNAITDKWKETPTVLLQGVTSSGKTEIYIDLIARALDKGYRAFFLVPEIALTTQLTSRLQKYFGKRVLIYHSKFTDSERVDVWKKLLESDEPCVVIGARSAVFLPFGNLGLVVVDEEHDPSYKQADPAPRYNGRDVAIVLAAMHGAKTLLGSATPAVETRWKADNGKFGYVRLDRRFGNQPLPAVTVADVSAERKARTYRAPFTMTLVSKTNMALSAGHQAIFFLNRRGFAPVARCSACDWSPRCPNCDVALIYHKSRRLLECHYCGTVQQLPVVCPQCGEPKVEILGFGTERVEDALSENFPGKRILRMDLDTTRNKDGHQNIITTFSQGNADILVGTQMVTKGLDFGNVSVVGVLNADMMLNQPDFRASERTFNMLEQVAGRAGRRAGDEGKVIIQTSRPEHPVIRAVASHDYEKYYEREIEERRNFSFPPFVRIIVITLRHRDADTVHGAAQILSANLKSRLGSRVGSPRIPLVSRIQNRHIRTIMLKIETGASLSQVKDILKKAFVEVITADDKMRQVEVHYDVDPV